MRRLLPLAIAAGFAMTFATSVTAQDQGATLHKLFDEELQFEYREFPTYATFAGVHTYDDRLSRNAPADQARRDAAAKDFLARLHAIDRASLSETDKLNYDLFEFMLSSQVKMQPYREWRMPINNDSGFHADLLQLPDVLDLKTTKDYENYIARLNDVPRYFDENIANMRQGLNDGFTLASEILTGVKSIIDGQQFKRAEDSPLYKPFRKFPVGVPERDRARLTAAGKAAIEGPVARAYASFKTFFDTEYMPKARKTLGASELPQGRAYYDDLVRYFTTLDVTADQVHAVGLREVARIRSEMNAIIKQVNFQGDFAAFLNFLRTDPQFYAKTPEELLSRARFIAKEVDGLMPQYFGRLPRLPYGVEPVPADLAPNYTSGRYVPGPMTGKAAGRYWVNTYQLDKRTLYTLPSLTVHEAVPGHHHQIALSQELGDLPMFRRNLYPNAFGEGWGLYCEKLGVEMGIYKTPYEHFGRLTYEMWRAVRLVVDTGIHAKGWTRQQALDYLGSNTALSLHEVRTEIDRYIAWPGQALAYKMGELKIWELRRKAEKALGAKFDIRAFHDAILANGGVTLPILEKQIDAYIARAKAGA
jgi:uncharacterized protein (DUF885 family)